MIAYVTFLSADPLKVLDCTVHDNYSASYIEFSLTRLQDTDTTIVQQFYVNCTIQELNIEALVQKFNEWNLQPSTSFTSDEASDEMHDYLVVACDISMLRRS